MAIVSTSVETVTARTLILSALRKIRAVDVEETPPAYQIQNGLEALNDLISSWATERLLVYSITQRTGALVAGTSSYTIGSGKTFDVPRPQRIEQAFIRVSNVDYAVEIIEREVYMSFVEKTTKGRPEYLYYDAYGKVYVYPTPDVAYTLYMDNWEPLLEFAEPTTSHNFPPEYKLAFKSNLAILLAIEYGKKVDPDLRDLARTSKGAIKRLNARPLVSSLDYFNQGGSYNILSG